MTFDCAIIGAGPAGMAAALTLSRAGAKTLVLDKAARAGGQIYRSAAHSNLEKVSTLGEDYARGANLIKEFEASPSVHECGADVWHIGTDGTLLFSQEGQTKQAQAREILVCTGAMERPMPIPGWTLPGVMTAGAAQVMLKSDAIAADKAIFVGSGPLLYLIVAQYLRLGVPVAALVDTTPRQNYLAATPFGPGALRSWRLLLKGLSLLREISAAGVTVYKGATDLRILGESEVESLSFNCDGLQQLRTKHVFLHHGVIPQTNMTRSLGLDHIWNEEQACWQVQSNVWGQTSAPHISVAGDGAGILGAEAAEMTGRVAALNILSRLGKISPEIRDQGAHQDLANLKKQKAFRRFLDRLYLPAKAQRLPQDPETLVCRCEEQTLRDLRCGFDKGAKDPNALKSLTRCGMGPCQGRQCGPILSGLLAEWRDTTESEVGYYRLRSPQGLLSLQELSQLKPMSQHQNRKGST